LRAAPLQTAASEVGVRHRPLRIVTHCPGGEGRGTGELAALEVDEGAAEGRLEAGSDPTTARAPPDGSVVPAALPAERSEVGQDAGSGGRELQGAAERADRLLRPTLQVEHHAEICVEARVLEAQLERAAQQLLGLVEALLLRANAGQAIQQLGR